MSRRRCSNSIIRRFGPTTAGRRASIRAAAATRPFDATLYAGVRPWHGAEVWVNPEIDQGFGLSDTLGVAGFPSGEAYKVGADDALFAAAAAVPAPDASTWAATRKTVDAGPEPARRLAGTPTGWCSPSASSAWPTSSTPTSYAHDPRRDFLNWSLIDAGTFDYAADAWGYTYGAAAEWYAGRWTLAGRRVRPVARAQQPRARYEASASSS